MHIPRFLSSRHSPSQAPSNGPITPKPSHRIREFLGFGRPHKYESPKTDSSNEIDVSSSSRLSSSPRPVQQAQNGPVRTVNAAGPYSHPSELVASLMAWDATLTTCPTGPSAPPSITDAPPSSTTVSNSGQGQDLLVTPHLPSLCQEQTIPPRQHSPLPHDDIPGPPPATQNIWNIQESKNIFVDGNNNNINYTTTYNTSSNKFMTELWDKTIQGAAFDSSARDPPPRCHPGTRLAVIARCLEFIATATGNQKVRWVVGQAGVGKSAIMQNVAESPLPSVSERASIFLSINGRNEGAKIVMTLVYQLAAQCEPYREFVEHEIARHPGLLHSSMAVQFNKFIVEPFVYHPQLKSVGRILIIIDGLDECDKPETQRQLLEVISDACSTYPSLPIVWLIASRPEHHITSFFDQRSIKAIYVKEEILVDSDEARSDVERFLRAELRRIQKEFSLSPQSEWPSEQDLWKLAGAAGGLFVYAQTAIKYIGDIAFGDPISQLDDVLKVIDAHPLSDVPRDQHPLALLDALYARILSKVPKRIMLNTRKLLLVLALHSRGDYGPRFGGFLVLCNWLGMTCDEAYTAIRHLRSVLDAPRLDAAHKLKLQAFHKSFIDYISDFTRSGFSPDIEHEARQLEVQYVTRILRQAPDGIDGRGIDPRLYATKAETAGTLVNVPDAGTDIKLTWPTEEGRDWSDRKTRFEVYKWAFLYVIEGIRTGQPVLCTEFYIRLIITHWRLPFDERKKFPLWELVNFVFDKSRSHEFLVNGILKKVFIRKLDFNLVRSYSKLRFRRPARTTTNLFGPWQETCKHERTGNWGPGKDEDWTTDIGMGRDSSFYNICDFCVERLKRQLKNQLQSPNPNVTVLFTALPLSLVEFQYIDPSDGLSQWTYWFMFTFGDGGRRELGSTV